MNLEKYLKNNTMKDVKQERIHSSFIETICNNLNEIGIGSPYKIFKEVRLSDLNKKNKEEKGKKYTQKNRFNRQSDLVIFNSDLYIIEAKVIRTNNPERKERNKIRELRRQLSEGFSFFKKNFKTYPILIGAYKRLNSNHFYFYYQNSDGRGPLDSEISKISC